MTFLRRLALVAVPALAACATDPAAPTMPVPEESEPESEPEPAPELPPDPPASLVPGALDPSFGTGGIQPLALGAAYAAAVDSQGDKLIVCSTVIDGAAWVARVNRYEATGALDTTFGTEGRATFADVGNVGCRDLAVLPDGRILVHIRLANGTSTTRWLTADGAPGNGAGATGLGFGPKVSVAPYGIDWGVTFGAINGVLSIDMVSKSAAGGPSTEIVAESVVRTFVNGVDMSAVTRIDDGGSVSWQVVRRVAGIFSPLGAGARATAGTPAPDMLNDAIRLPDGSWFAVGAVDSGVEVMAARFVDGASKEVFVEHHRADGAAEAMAVALDGMDRPVVVGKAIAEGQTRFSWQRYEPLTATLDSSYQTGGVAIVAPPSGQGELVDVVRVNGAIYAIGSYDVETPSPKVALVKFAE